MIGLEVYSATKKSFVGIDWLNLTSGALKATGGAFGGGGAAGGNAAAEAAAAKARAEEQKKAAEANAAMWKKVGIGAGVVLVLGGAFVWLRKSGVPIKKAAA